MPNNKIAKYIKKTYIFNNYSVEMRIKSQKETYNLIQKSPRSF